MAKGDFSKVKFKDAMMSKVVALCRPTSAIQPVAFF